MHEIEAACGGERGLRVKPLRPLVLEHRMLGALELATGAVLAALAVVHDWVVLVIALPVVAIVYAVWMYQMLYVETLTPLIEAAGESPGTAVESRAATTVRCAALVAVFAAALVPLALAIDFFTVVAAFQVGQGGATLATATRLAGWERERDARLLRAAWRRGQAAALYVTPRSRTPP